MSYPKSLIVQLFLVLAAGPAIADRTDLPHAYYKHGLIEDAKREFISIVFDREADDEEKAKSLSALGDIAFDTSTPDCLPSPYGFTARFTLRHRPNS